GSMVFPISAWKPPGMVVCAAATGTLHVPRMAWPNFNIIWASMMSTDLPLGMFWQSVLTAATSPTKVRLNASPVRFPAIGCRAIPAAQAAITATRGARLRYAGTSTKKTDRDLRASQAAIHTASRITPGSTVAARRRLAIGWCGVIAGRSRKMQVAQANTRVGSTQTGASPLTHRLPNIAYAITANAMVTAPAYQ